MVLEFVEILQNVGFIYKILRQDKVKCRSYYMLFQSSKPRCKEYCGKDADKSMLNLKQNNSLKK